MNARVKYLLGLLAAGAIAMLISALAARDAHALEPGEKHCREDVCIVKAQILYFGGLLFDFNERMQRENTGNLVAYKRQLRAQLQRDFTDAELFVLWDDPHARATIQSLYPGAWAVMSEVMRDLAYEHRFNSGRTYKLDY